MQIADKDIHKGHRARMRSKLEAHGPRIFDTYELLEMLLYHVIPYKDTNPIAKRLLHEFGSLDGVLRASVSELSAVDGIGERCAEFISLAGKVIIEEEALAYSGHARVFTDYNDVGRYLVSYFKESKANICMIMLDNGMRLIDVVDIPGDYFSSAAVKPRHFIDPVVLHGAAVVIIANKRHSAMYLSDGDLATDKLIRGELSNIGVPVAEHYVVSGNDYTGIRTKFSLGATTNMPELEKFYNSIPGYGGEDYER